MPVTDESVLTGAGSWLKTQQLSGRVGESFLQLPYHVPHSGGGDVTKPTLLFRGPSYLGSRNIFCRSGPEYHAVSRGQAQSEQAGMGDGDLNHET